MSVSAEHSRPGTPRNFKDIVRSPSDSQKSPTMPMHFHLPRVQSFSNVMDQVRDVMKHYKHEKESEAHRIFRQSAGHKVKGVLPQTINPVRLLLFPSPSPFIP